MLKNKKILLIILSFIFVLFFNTNSFAYTVDELKDKATGYYYVIYTYDDINYLIECNTNSFFYDSTSKQLFVDNSYNYTSSLGAGRVVVTSTPAYIPFDTILYSYANIYYYGTENVFFQERGDGTSSDNTGSDSSNGEGEGNSKTDTERTNFFTSVGDWFDSLFTGITQGFTTVFSFFENLINRLNPWHEDFILTGVLNFLGDILSYLNPFSENFLGKKLVELLENVIKAIFVPDEEKINNLVYSVKSKFEFVDTIKFAISDLKNFLTNIDESDNITMNLSNKYWSGEVTILNFSWFSQYKTYTDSIITAFIYICYLWRLFISLPNIIAGVGGTVSFDTQIEEIKAGFRTGFKGGVRK